MLFFFFSFAIAACCRAIRLLICDCYVLQGNSSFDFAIAAFCRAIHLLIYDCCIFTGQFIF